MLTGYFINDVCGFLNKFVSITESELMLKISEQCKFTKDNNWYHAECSDKKDCKDYKNNYCTGFRIFGILGERVYCGLYEYFNLKSELYELDNELFTL